ncbi:elongation factor 1-delta [Tanacetum coccineum]
MAMSSILLDVKLWDDETDMQKLEEAVRGVQMEGLTWGASKLVPVGFGMKKLQIMMTIVDDLVSVDAIIEDKLTQEPINEVAERCYEPMIDHDVTVGYRRQHELMFTKAGISWYCLEKAACCRHRYRRYLSFLESKLCESIFAALLSRFLFPQKHIVVQVGLEAAESVLCCCLPDGWSVDWGTKVCVGVVGLRLGGGNAIGFESSTAFKMKSGLLLVVPVSKWNWKTCVPPSSFFRQSGG